MKHWEEKAKGWVFLSHSSNDYENVKIVRDYLEENGFSALMFYLKCLEKDKKHLRKELIESEISERNIFVLCQKIVKFVIFLPFFRTLFICLFYSYFLFLFKKAISPMKMFFTSSSD